jgi:hypothetical protein
MGLGLGRLLFVRGELYRHAPQYTTPWHVRACIALLALSFALTAHEADGLAVPIMHQVKRDAAGQMQRERRRKVNKAIAKVDREYVLMGYTMINDPRL